MAVDTPMPWAPRRLRDRMLLSYIPAVLLTITATVVAAWGSQLGLRYGDQVLFATRLIGAGNELQNYIASAQSAVRGYAITGEQSYLEPYRYAVYELERQRSKLGETWAARPDDQDQVARALMLFFKWRVQVAEPLIKEQHSHEEMTALLKHGQPIIAEATRYLRGVVMEERELLQIHSREHESAVRWGTLVAAGAPLLALAYVLAANFWLTRRTVQAVESVSRAAEDFAAGDLSRRVHLKSADELGSLARTFNAMAERLVERTEETQCFIELAQTLQVTLSRQEVAELFVGITPLLLPIPAGQIFLHDPTTRLFNPFTGWGMPNAEAFPGSACWAIRLGRSYRSAEENGAACSHIRSFDGLISLCVPMVVQGESLGLIQYLYEAGSDEATIRRTGTDVAERFAFTLSNLQLRERLREQSVRDPLTGLFNRRHLDETLHREIERARRFGYTLGLLMIDIDHFKELNDTLGHDAGDAILRELGRLLATAFRTGDEAYRYGGEEFLILMPNAGLADVLERARSLQHKLSRLHAVMGDRLIGPVTASIGVSCFPDDGNSPEELLRSVDQAMYRAKESGRDRIIASHEPEGRGGNGGKGAESRH